MLGDILNHTNIFRNQRPNSELGGGKVTGNIPETSQSKLALKNSLEIACPINPETVLNECCCESHSKRKQQETQHT